MWIVHVKRSGSRCVEVAAIQKSNRHGLKSWGWHSKEDKIIVLRVSDLYQEWPIPQSVIKAAITEAKLICNTKNKGH